MWRARGAERRLARRLWAVQQLAASSAWQAWRYAGRKLTRRHQAIGRLRWRKGWDCARDEKEYDEMNDAVLQPNVFI
jgi:hypothetical protein